MKDLIQIISQYNHPDSWAILVFLGVTFLLGLLLGLLLNSGKRRYKRLLKEKQKELDDLSIENRRISEQYDLKDADLKKAELELDVMGQNIAAADEEKNRLHAELYEANDSIEKLQAKVAADNSLIEDLNNQILGLKAKTNKLQDEEPYGGSTSTENLASLQSDYAKLKDRLAALEGMDLETLEAKVKLLETDREAIKNLEFRVDMLTQENALLKDFLSAEDEASARSSFEITAADLESEDEEEFEPAAQKAELERTMAARIQKEDVEAKDDLTRIEGIGPFIEEKLNTIGIHSFEQISHFDDDLIEEVTQAIQFFPGRIKRDDWVGQAKKLLEEDSSRGTPASYIDFQTPDDLTVVTGIPREVEELLQIAGINTVAQLAGTDVEHLFNILSEAGGSYSDYDPSDWPENARKVLNS